MAQTTRTSTVVDLFSPTRRISPLSSTRSSLACIALGSSPISSRKIVPPLATSKSPTRCSSAPVNAPFAWPNSSLSMSVSGSAPQLIATNGMSARVLWSWIDRATNSLPVPVSPSTITVDCVGATFSIISRTLRMPRRIADQPRRTLEAADPVLQRAILLRELPLVGDLLQHRLDLD